MDALTLSVLGHLAGVLVLAVTAWISRKIKLRAEQRDQFVRAIGRAIDRRKAIAKAQNDTVIADELKELGKTIMGELFDAGSGALVAHFHDYLGEAGINTIDQLRYVKPPEGQPHG